MPELNSFELDLDDPFDQIIKDMVVTNRKKRADYAGDSHWLQNFYDTAYQLSGTGGQSCELLIATKQARLRVLLDPKSNRSPANEAIEDTLLDRAVYSVLAVGLYREHGYDKSRPLFVGWDE